ncbi:type IX secretion system outer membrane channel protein PorV [Kordia zhangzhouensis]|uniref:type IX secretion system outer membrane channel protein PorV n=1 Tax=Kordia zhangzhouensis TaxID=1620405 RepID=UPI0006298166|nr:type IX secretion system outer membrane channel protein PorV [Kordia zhangzhouensis]
MKKLILFILCLIPVGMMAQTTVTNPNDTRVITTGVPFLLITPDARAGGMGELGVATSPDTYSQQWNPAKYAFANEQIGVGISYTPYLSDLVNDIFLGNLTFYNRINERSAWSASIKYFSLGEIEIITQQQADIGNFTPLIERPNELAIDASYALRLSDQFSMSVTGRFLRSDLKLQSQQDVEANAASTFAVDIAGYYQSEEIAYDNYNGRWRAGFNISNLGPKLKYDELGQENFLPTQLKLGGGFDFIFDEYNKLAVSAEVNKLLVPTPPILGFVDKDDDGNQDSDDLSTPDVDESEPTIIVEGQDDNVGFVSGIFQSFGDAPGGFSEELKEFTWALGAEYWYQDSFALRVGYFNESEIKGARKFFTLGAGFKYSAVKIDVSYLFSASKVRNPLENTLRFSLTFNLGETYDEF